MSEVLKPKKRSRLRLLLGKTYYTLKRYLLWLSPKYKFAKEKADKDLKHKCFEHKSLLLRKLRDVDMIYQYNKIINLKLLNKSCPARDTGAYQKQHKSQLSENFKCCKRRHKVYSSHPAEVAEYQCR